MSRKKPDQSPGLLRIWTMRMGRLVDALLPRSPGWILAVFALIGIVIGGYQAGRYVVPWVADSNHYQVASNEIVITQTPSWIRSDIKKKVILDASLDGSMSILDDDLKKRIWDAFEFHPWVKKVQRVELSAGPRINVELVYRCPVAIVRVEDNKAKEAELIPVDIEGRRLPSEDLTQAEQKQFPLITGMQGLPLAGEAWSDPRVAGAARLSLLLAKDWDELGFTEIFCVKTERLVKLMGKPWNELEFAKVRQLESDYNPKISPQKVLGKTSYLLGRAQGGPIIWGYAPSLNIPGEPTDSAKVVLLRKMLHPSAGSGGSQAMDLRRFMATERTARESSKIGPK